MTVITQRPLHLRLVLRRHLYTRLHFFSSSHSIPPADIPPPKSESESGPKPSFSSHFDEVKATLQKEPPSPNHPQSPRKPLSFLNSPQTSSPPSKSAYLDEIRRNLSGFRSRSAPPPPSSTSGQYVSFQESYKRNVAAKDDDSATSSNTSAKKPPVGRSFDSIRENYQTLRSDSINPLSAFRESLNLKPGLNADPRILGRSENDFGGSKLAMRMYEYSELGKKLQMLRPEKKKKTGKWFSLQELNERLAKLREMDEKEGQENVAGISWKELRGTLAKLAHSGQDKTKKTVQSLDILGQFGGTPEYMLSDPKDHLVKQYFHPDNMSSAEKIKLELKRVRDEFKMSESDCGSARVQVAQLTMKINHLSLALHKKDKHSRKGLVAMVQRRKKLLKYLRRTDWDSYCLLLSKFGLRDTSDVKT